MTAIRGSALAAAFLCSGLGCYSTGEELITPPETDPTVNGDWSGTLGPWTVRYSLTEGRDIIGGSMELVVVGYAEGNAPVRGSRAGQRVELRAEGPAFAELTLNALMTATATFSGTQFGNEIVGEFDFRGTGNDPATGSRFVVEIQPAGMPLTLVRVGR